MSNFVCPRKRDTVYFGVRHYLVQGAGYRASLCFVAPNLPHLVRVDTPEGASLQLATVDLTYK